MPAPILCRLGACDVGVGQTETTCLRGGEDRELNPSPFSRRRRSCRKVSRERRADQLAQGQTPLYRSDLGALHQLVRQVQGRSHKNILAYPCQRSTSRTEAASSGRSAPPPPTAVIKTLRSSDTISKYG